MRSCRAAAGAGPYVCTAFIHLRTYARKEIHLSLCVCVCEDESESSDCRDSQDIDMITIKYWY